MNCQVLRIKNNDDSEVVEFVSLDGETTAWVIHAVRKRYPYASIDCEVHPVVRGESDALKIIEKKWGPAK